MKVKSLSALRKLRFLYLLKKLLPNKKNYLIHKKINLQRS
ncbi:hypothetical protein P9202_1043 [Prochlorococcus marinus str. MIT 9202]|nr:hypothetical protein P9202_1043 [Prochlorococcus marinus str. MIT 9202]